MEMGVCIEEGDAWEIKWCPRGGNGEEEGMQVDGEEGCGRLGILAGAFADGSISLFAVPDPVKAREEKGVAEGEVLYSKSMSSALGSNANALFDEQSRPSRFSSSFSPRRVAILWRGRAMRRSPLDATMVSGSLSSSLARLLTSNSLLQVTSPSGTSVRRFARAHHTVRSLSHPSRSTI